MAGDVSWVFGYGSLIWEPGFAFIERLPARVSGWQRSFCMRSVHFRGTTAAPGLVLALDAEDGAECAGLAFGVAGGDWPAVLAYLRERELIYSAYRERLVPMRLADGREAQGLAYVIDPAHALYAGRLGLAEQAAIIAASAGARGRNAEYLYNTVAHLAELGIGDPGLEALAGEVRRLTGEDWRR